MTALVRHAEKDGLDGEAGPDLDVPDLEMAEIDWVDDALEGPAAYGDGFEVDE